jgi:hypothetical protein
MKKQIKKPVNNRFRNENRQILLQQKHKEIDSLLFFVLHFLVVDLNSAIKANLSPLVTNVGHCGSLWMQAMLSHSR